MVCEDQGYYELTGLVSWGFGCGRQDVPGVYVKVSLVHPSPAIRHAYGALNTVVAA